MIVPPVPLFMVLVAVFTPRAVVRRVTAHGLRYVMRCRGVIQWLMCAIYGIHRVSDRTADMYLPVGLHNDCCTAAPTADVMTGLVRKRRS